MEIVIYILVAIFGLFQIVLFFKIWGMTSDIRAIKEKYLQSENSNANKTMNENDDLSSKFKIGDLVINKKTEKKMRIKTITNDRKYSCYSNGGITHEGDFTEDEIEFLIEFLSH